MQFCILGAKGRDFDPRFEKELINRWMEITAIINTIGNFDSLPTTGGLESVISVDENDKSFEEKGPSGILLRQEVTLSKLCYTFLNALMVVGYFPKPWKNAKIAMVPTNQRQSVLMIFYRSRS